MNEAIASADLIGVRDDVLKAAPEARNLDSAAPDFLEKFRSSFPLREAERNLKLHPARRIFQLYQRIQAGLPPGAALSSQWVCYELAARGFWDELFGEVEHIGLVTSLDGLDEKLRRRFGLDVEVAKIPPKSIDRGEPSAQGPDEQFPQAFENILRQLSRPLHGRVFLVGAGLVGKYYLHVIKQNGGIGLDVGALLDVWQGIPKRRLVLASKAPLQDSAFAAPPLFRLGAGRLGGGAGRTAKRLVFHVGFSKTGSTAIQHALRANDRLLADHGVNYVRAGREDGAAVNHHQLARAFGMGEAEAVADGRALSRLLEEIDAEIRASSQPVQLISSELFTNTSPARETEDDLIALLNRHEITVVAFLRNQFDWLVSWYGQAAKNRNMDMTLQDFLSKPARLEKFDGNFLRKLDWFERYTPRGSVRVVSYDATRANVLAAFADAAKLPVVFPDPPASRNVRLSSAQIASGVVARKLGLDLKLLADAEWPDELVAKLLLEGRHAPQLAELRSAVEARFAAVNAAIQLLHGVEIGKSGTAGDGIPI